MPSLVFGTGGRFGRLSKPLASKLVSCAIDHGIRYFDTGYEYSSRRSQPLLFKILDQHSTFLAGSNEISTKFSAPQFPGQLTAFVDNSLSQLSRRDYLDTAFLWGPTLSDLATGFLYEEMLALKVAGKVRSWGINTHSSTVMSGVLGRVCESLFDHVMLDYNLCQQDRAPFIKSFHDQNVSVWAGTALCQGFLSQSLLRMILRTRSSSYLLRAICQPSTRRFLAPARLLRHQIKALSGKNASNLPLAFVAANPYVSRIPIGMLSTSSIQANVGVIHAPLDESVIHAVSKWALAHCQV